MREITVVLACHDQGRFLHASVRSIEAAIRKAESDLGITIEWLFSADNPSEETEEYLKHYLPSMARLLIRRCGQAYSARNEAVQEAQGRFIATVSGDDLVSSNWLSRTYRASVSRPADVVHHPGMVAVFGDGRLLFITPDQEDPEFSAAVLFSRNAWPDISFARKEIFLSHPFREPDKVRGFGYPDWHWVCDTMAGGIIHKPVRATFACCRHASGHSCLTAGEKQPLLLPSARLFQVFNSQCEA